MTGDGIIPPRPSGALPLSQGESLGSHPQLCDITKVEKSETPKPAPAATPAPASKPVEAPKVEVMSQSRGSDHGNTGRNYGDTDSPSKIEGVAGGRGSMTGDGIIPPRPSGALPLSQGESAKAEEKKADEVAKADEKKDAKKKKEKSDKPERDALITADRTDYDRKEGVVLFDRNVHVDDAQYQMHADRLFLFLDGTNDLKRLVAIGHVAITNEDKRAYCARATFNKKLGRVVMYSSDEITAELREEGKKGSDVKGEKITFWLDSEQVEVENPVITMPGGFGGQGDMKKLIGK